jgi:hypothetical protein
MSFDAFDMPQHQEFLAYGQGLNGHDRETLMVLQGSSPGCPLRGVRIGDPWR